MKSYCNFLVLNGPWYDFLLKELDDDHVLESVCVPDTYQLFPQIVACASLQFLHLVNTEQWSF